ncbi:hypothetical protein OC835_001226 [Tilletia horrida]|nr:hypothetical protein OC835_001226 [Tilletia horrida]
MSLSKYTDLPDIDTAGQDLYETPEVPSPSFSDDDADDVFHASTGARSGGAAAPRRSGASTGPGTVAAATGGSTASGGVLAQPSIDIESATAKFRRATEADGRGADFSGALHRQPRKPAQLYPSTLTFETDTYEIRGYSSSAARRKAEGGGEGQGEEKESAVDKLRRLRAETQALEEELRAQADQPSQDGQIIATAAAAAAEGGASAAADAGVSPLQILDQLRKLRVDLGKLDAAAAAEREGTGHGALGSASWEAEARALIAKLGASGMGSKEEDATGSGAVEGNGAVPQESGGAGPSATRELVQLESRLASLENLVGLRPALVDESKAPSRPLLPTMQRLEHQLTLFTQPRHLDAISRRVKVLVAELERAHEARAKLAALPPASAAKAGADVGTADAEGGTGEGGAGAGAGSAAHAASSTFGTPDQLARLRSLFLLQTRLEPLLPLAPHLLSRLQSLSALHSSAALFGSSLEHLVEADARLGERATEVRELCMGLEGSMREDSERVKGNLELVQARLEALGKRMEALGV